MSVAWAEIAIAELMDAGLRDDWLFLQDLTRCDRQAADAVGNELSLSVDAWNRGARYEYASYENRRPHVLLLSRSDSATKADVLEAITRIQDIKHSQVFEFGTGRAHALLSLEYGASMERTIESLVDGQITAVALNEDSVYSDAAMRRHVDPIGQLWVPDEVVTSCAISQRRLADYFSSQPSKLRHADISPRDFEKLIAEIWEGLGYEVELTQQTRDGGYDVVAVRDREARMRFLISCKHLKVGRKVAIDPVRNLYGVLQHERANKGILATTVTFTQPASAFIEAHPWELEGRDHDGLLDWLNLYNESVHGTL